MLEQLEGRLKWERTADGIFVSIPVRRGASTIGYAMLVLVWITIASVHYWHLFSQPRGDAPNMTLQLIAIGLYVFGFFVFIAWGLWAVTGETVLILDSSEMKIQQRILGIDFSTRKYRTNEAWNFRFVKPVRFWALRADTDPGTSKIQFNSPKGAQSFGKGIAESEAKALIERMVEVYRFHRSGDSYHGAFSQ
jgi:hypothetical protein